MLIRKNTVNGFVGHFLAWFMVVQIVFMPVVSVRALPRGEQVTHGNVKFHRVGNRMIAVQHTGSAIVNYNSFNIASPETVRFIQPRSSAAILNRVTGGGSTTIAGALFANGRVYLINPNGILFSSSARVNVGGLVASAMNLSDSDFLSGNLNFSGGGGSVVNAGSISAGFAYLVGANVENRGTIRGRDVIMAAGQDSVLIDRAAGGEVRLVIDGEERDINRFGPWDDIEGTIEERLAAMREADASMDDEADDEAGAALAAEMDGARQAVTNGMVVNAGHIDAVGLRGGNVFLRGERVGQYGKIHADGLEGDGGTVDLVADDLVFIDRDSATTANAGRNGDGGDLFIFGTEAALVETGARMEARGGAESGDGGTAEISTRGALEFGAFPDTSAPHGHKGYIIIDPLSITIKNSDDQDWDWDEDLPGVVPTGSDAIVDIDSLEKALRDYGGVIIRTDQSSGGEQGDIFVNASINYNDAGNADLYLNSADDIRFNSRIYDSSSGGDRLNVYFVAADEITLDASIRSGGGDIYMIAEDYIDNDHVVRSSGGDIVFSAREIVVNASIDAGGGDMSLIADTRDLDVNAALSAEGDMTLIAGDDIYISAAVSSGGEMFLKANDLASINGELNARWGGVSVIGGRVIQYAAGDIRGADVLVLADSGSINMANGATTYARDNYDIIYKAETTADITGLNARYGSVIVSAGGSITDAGGSATDIKGSSALLVSSNGNAGTYSSMLETDIDTLAGFASGSFGVRQVSGGGDLAVGTVGPFNFGAAGPTGSIISVSIPAFEGVVVSGNGDIRIETDDGDLDIDKFVIADGPGDIRLVAGGSGHDVTVNDSVAAGGTIVVTAADTIYQNAAVASYQSGGLDLNATAGSVIMNDDATLFSNDGDVTVDADDNITLSSVITSNGNVAVTAGGSIAQNSNILALVSGSVDVQALGGSITMAGDTLTYAGDGDIAYDAAANATLQTVITDDGNIEVVAGQNVNQQAEILSIGSGNIRVTAESGSITMADGTLTFANEGEVRYGAAQDIAISSIATTNGNILVFAGNSVTQKAEVASASSGFVVVAAGSGSIAMNPATLTYANDGNIRYAAGGDITVGTLATSTGSISVVAGGSIVQSSNIASAVSGTVDVEALGGSITMADGVVGYANDGNIRYAALQDVTLSSLVATQGDVSVVALLGSILDGGDALPEVIANRAEFYAPNGGVGTLGSGTDDGLEIVVQTAAAEAGGGGINLLNVGDLEIGTVPGVVVGRVQTNGITIPVLSGTLSGLVTSDDGSIVVLTLGSVTVNDAVSAGGEGNILLLSATGGVNNITFNAPVSSGSGDITLMALSGSILQNALGDANTTSGDIAALALDGEIRMADGAESGSGGGDILYVASSNIVIGSLNAGTGTVSAIALGGSITDGGDTHRDVVADRAQLAALRGAVGDPLDGLETEVDTLAAYAGNGGIKVTELDDLTIGTVGPVSVDLVQPDSTVVVTNTVALSGLIASNGSILVETEGGSITVTDAVVNLASGNILLDANGAGSDVTISNLVLARNGNISLLAADAIDQYSILASITGGTVDVWAETGSIFMDDNALTISAAGSIRYRADRDITLGSLISPRAPVSLISKAGSILDGGDLLFEILAPSARVTARDDIGVAANPLDTLMLILAARSYGGSIYIGNESALAVTTIPGVTVNRVQPDGSTVAISDISLSDVTTGHDGNISLRTLNGPILVTDGASPSDHIGVRADGYGNVRLAAEGPDGFIVTLSGVESDLGNVCLLADDSVILGPNTTFVRTGGYGDIAIWADKDADGSGDVLHLDGTIKSEFGNIYVYGQNILQFGAAGIESEGGSIALYAENAMVLNGSGGLGSAGADLILSAGRLTLNNEVYGRTVALRAEAGPIRGRGLVTGDAVSLYAFSSIGTARDPFDVDAGTLATLTLLGDAFINAHGSVIASWVVPPDLSAGTPACALSIPVPTATVLHGIRAGGSLLLNVEENLSGDTVAALRGDARVNVNGSVTGLDLLSAGDDILLRVRGNYLGREISAGGSLLGDIGGRLTFDEINAWRADVNAYRIDMSRVNVSSSARFTAARSIHDRGSYIRASDVSLVAGGNIGANRPIRMYAGSIGTIAAGGDINFVQRRGGDTPIGLISAGGNLAIRSAGGFVDRNGAALNLEAMAAQIDATHLGTLEDALEVNIGPGNLQVNGAGLSGETTGDGYVFVHLTGSIETLLGRKVDYIGSSPIPGLMILNGQVIGGNDRLLRRFFRAEAFLDEVPRLIAVPSLLGDPWFINVVQPVPGSREIFIEYILRDQAGIEIDEDRVEEQQVEQTTASL